MSVDVLQLIDRLEALISSGARLPLTSRALVDEQEVLDILDQLRMAVPEEIRQAKRLSQERERLLLQAQAEAEKIIAAAEERAKLILAENELVKAAQERAAAIIREAEERAEEIRRGAASYVLEVLTGLETELMRLLATVRKGKATVERAVQGEFSREGRDERAADR